MEFGGGDEIRFERRGVAGVVTLTRSKALNALTHGMIRALAKALAAWEQDKAVALVVMKAEGRAFCAGGDLAHAYDGMRTGNPPLDFFADEYRLNAALARFPKPCVSLIDGIVMGGGVGVSCHGSHRVMTEKALFAMPEVGIGFFPDVGASFLLSRLKRSFGMYLGLTGTRIRAGDACRAGIATHVVSSASLDEILEGLCKGTSPDRVLRPFASRPDCETDEGTLFAIARLFSRDRLDDLLLGLRQARDEGEAIADSALAAIEKASPTSVAVAFREINTGAMLEMDDCMRMEFRILNRMLAGHDFPEGIRAVIIDKDGAPKWRPPSLAELSEPAVDAYFAPLPGGDLEV
ncbi:enoyl-CoA hydratase/isomerase family protein [Pseudaminobacter sp. 19-2017]|uniref:3-hydroxyisobutyryl-CoA hydrolase n=1 Tax=Pseudaminobacter soli (ex Zhang et al. 2022) TaxID=2831468 RepID=A0A942IAK0_9HYPH|nr:enoyl-CoA hydratase/isomerase family protein [Pseudaminobacter soli]MBS3651410.1 enoyl-CoA hydratase/isomerase family protein [Pseudaminobacter soli]